MTGAPLSLLDNIRVSNGPEGLRSFFSELLHTDRIGLVELLNDRHLCFSTVLAEVRHQKQKPAGYVVH